MMPSLASMMESIFSIPSSFSIFRDNLHGRTFFIQNLPDLADRIGIADKRSRHKIKACIHAEQMFPYLYRSVPEA